MTALRFRARLDIGREFGFLLAQPHRPLARGALVRWCGRAIARRDRARILRGAARTFAVSCRWHASPRSAHLPLVDDVPTYSSTLDEAAACRKAAGALTVTNAGAARTP